MLRIFVIVLILFHPPNWVEPLDIPVITQLQDVIGIAHDIGDILSGNIPLQDFFVSKVDPMSVIMQKIDGITQQLDNLDVKLDNLLATLIARLPLEDSINTDIRDLQEYINRIDDVYNYFLAYSKNVSSFDEDTLMEFVGIVTSAKTNYVPDILSKIFNIIVPKKSALNRVGFLENMAQKRKMMDPLEKCNPQISYQNRLLQIYNLISITEIKTFLMTAYAFKLKKELKNVGSQGETKQARNNFIIRLDQYLTEFKKNMMSASREIFLCDPESVTDKDTYVELEGLFMAYVLNEYEVGMNPCSGKCHEIYTWTHHRCYKLYDENYCPKHPCKGLIHDCGWIGGDVDICEYDRSEIKRYNYLRSYSNGWYGKWTECDDPATYQQVRGHNWHWYSCDMCICKCEESYGSSKAIRTFSLREQVTNIDENKVVSDVKFVQKDHMIHIQIEESPLQALGFLDRNQSSWVPLEDFIYLSNVTGGGWVQVKDGQNIPMIRDTDFAFIRRDQRKLNLDEISGGPNMVLTGLRLRHESEEYTDDESAGNVSPLQLEIRVTPFNYTSGELMATEDNPSVWITPLTQPKLPSEYAENRKELEIGDYAYRWESAPSPPNLKPNLYIEFRQSTIHSDVGQSTMPFMDSRPTAPSSLIAFDGLGIAYRGDKKFGGFIILKPMTIDFTNYIDASMTAEQKKYYHNHLRAPLRISPRDALKKNIASSKNEDYGLRKKSRKNRFE